MAKVKALSIKMIKRVIEEKGYSFEKDYLPRLTEEERKSTEKLAIGWMTIAQEKKGNMIYEAAQLLFPGPDKESMFKFGELQSKTMPFFYKIFLSIPKAEKVITKFPNMWKTFYDTGEFIPEELTSNSVSLVLKNYPDYPLYLRQYLSGWLKGFLEIINLKINDVRHDDQDPNAYKWTLKWD